MVDLGGVDIPIFRAFDPVSSLFFPSFSSSFLESFLGSGPEGVDDLCFHTYDMGHFLLLFLRFLILLLILHPPSNPSLEAQTPVLRPKSQS